MPDIVIVDTSSLIALDKYEKVQELRNKGFYISDKLLDGIKKLE